MTASAGSPRYTSPGVSTIAPLTQRSAHSALGGAKACEFLVLQGVQRRRRWNILPQRQVIGEHSQWRAIMIDIPGPKARADNEGRIIDCEFAIEPAFQALIAAAKKVNWPTDDIAIALANLASANIRMRLVNAATDRELFAAYIQRLADSRSLDS